MKRVTTVIVGAGRGGLATTLELGQRPIDHIVLERGRIGHSWRAERWDSPRLLTPNWINGPAGHPYWGPDPDGFMSAGDFASSPAGAAARDGVPVMTDIRVLGLPEVLGGSR